MNLFNRLRTRILFWMVLVAVVPLLVVAFQSYQVARQAIITVETEHLRSEITAVQARLQTWMARMESELRFLGTIPCVLGGCEHESQLQDFWPGTLPDDASCRDFMGRIDVDAVGFQEVITLNRNWQTFDEAAGGAVHDGHNHYWQNDELRRRMEQSDGLEIYALPGPDGTKPELLVGYVVKDPRTGEQNGFLIARLVLAKVLRPMIRKSQRLIQTGQMFIFDQAGKCLVGSTPAVSANPADLDPVWAQLSEFAPRTYQNSDGDDVLGMVARLPQLDWHLLVEVRQDELFSLLNILRERVIWTSVLAVLVIAALALWIARELASPLQKLASVARGVSDGQGDLRVAPLSGREAQEVGNAFNLMLDRLRETREQMVQTASLAAVGELSTSLVHEMRTPLAAIKLNVQALKRRVEGDEVYTEMTVIAEQQTDRLERLLNELMQYARPVTLKLEVFRPVDLVREVLNLLQAGVENKFHLDLVNLIGDDTLRADRELLKRALTNLLENAFQFSKTGDTVHIRLERAGNQMLLMVDDQGPGIPEAYLEKLFQPFFTTRQDGTGLGLANVRKFVRLHMGTVSAQNRATGGARFIIQLPLKETL